MKIIKPIPITNENLLTGGFDYDYPGFSNAVTYNLGDIVEHHNPSSVVTINNDPAEPVNLIYWADHQFAVDTPVVFTTDGELPIGSDYFIGDGKIYAGRAYFIQEVYGDYFSISNELGGPAKAIYGAQSGTHTATATWHRKFKSAIAGNLGNPPRKHPDKWTDLGATNQWKMYDGSVTSQTEDFYIYRQIKLNRPADSLCLFNMAGSALNVNVVDAVEGELYNKDINLISNAGINDFWDWCFQPIERVNQIAITDLPPCNDAILSVYLKETTPARYCQVGAMIVGMAADSGATQHGAEVGIQDFSVKVQDEFGNWTRKQRQFTNKVTFEVQVPKAKVDRFFTILAKYRASNCVYIGSDAYGCSMIFGFPSDWRMSIGNDNFASLKIDLEGL